MTTQATAGSDVKSGGAFERDTDYLTDRITADGRSAAGP